MKESSIYPPSELKRTIPIIVHNNPTGSERRPDHYDFMTSSELKRAEFSGMRQNQLAMQWELWLVGEIKGTVSFEAAAKDHLAVTRMHAEVFHMILPT